MRNYTTQQFIEKAKKVHGNKYDYSKVEYVKHDQKICIICPEHGEFWQTPASHLNGRGCLMCSKERLRNKFSKGKDDFVKEAIAVHGNKYDYSKVEYINNGEKVCIICPTHGEFWQLPTHHIQRKHGCPKCYHKNANLTKDEFVKEAIAVHGNKYDYSQSYFTKMTTKIKIICPEHGEFWQTPYKHIKEHQGCLKCSKKYSYTTEEWVLLCKKIHNDKYDYSKSAYINYDAKVCIICPEHGEFWQSGGAHLSGAGCPSCNESKIEKEIATFLTENNIKFVREHTEPWLKYKHKLFIDFYLPEKKIVIECQGIQHFKPVDFGSKGKEYAQKLYLEIIKRDSIKKELCEAHGLTVLYYTKEQNAPDDNFIKTKEKLLEEINKKETSD